MKVHTSAVLAILAMSGVVAGGSRIFNAPRNYGPYTCVSSCQLLSPGPDAGTLAYIRSMDQSNSGSLADYAKVPGDTFTVCNGSYCVAYRRTDSIEFFSGAAAAAQRTPGAGGGTGNGNGPGTGPGTGGPGGGGGSGCAGKCEGGKVIMGTEEPIRP